MIRFKQVALVLILSLAVLNPAISANLAKELGKREVVMWEHTDLGMGLKDISFIELKSKISDVVDTPCELVFGRTVLSNPTSGLLGVITGALGVRVAMQKDIDAEEGGMEQAFFTHPVDESEWKTWIDYLNDKNSTEGGTDLKTALLLRRKARVLKFQFWLKDATGKDFTSVTEDDVNRVKEDLHYRWLANDIFEPVTIILKPELAKVLFKNKVDTGPAFGPIPTLNLISKDEVQGDYKSVDGCIVDKKGRFIVRRTDSVVLLSDIKGMFLIDDSIERDSLGDVIGHELFHGIMSDLMGVDAPGGAKSKSQMGHDAQIISDNSMAVSEGWAEFFEAWSGEDNAAFNNRGGQSKVTRFLLGRQVPIRRGLYTQADFEKYRSTKKTGCIKNGSQMEATEGLVAGILYKILSHEDIDDPFAIILEAMYRHHPQTQSELVQAMIDCSPDDKTRRIITLTFLHETKFATVSAEAHRLYQVMYTAKLNFVRQKNNGVTDEEAEDLRTAYSAARSEYKEFITPLERDVLSGALALNANVGPEIWMDGSLKVVRDGKEQSISYRINLNTVTLSLLERIMGSADVAAKIIEARDALGFVNSVSDLSRYVSDDALAFLLNLQKQFAASENQ
jgi:DNA uptake protein ComE-like DNA-binding protein